MQFNVAQLLKEPIGSGRAYTLDEALTLETGQSVPLKGGFRATRTDKGIWVNGALAATVPGQCSRCLKNLKQNLAFELDEEYLQKFDLTNGSPIEADETDQDSFKLDERHTLDLREALRQYVISNLPMNPVCKQSCKGLCPQCGTDWNKSQCTCTNEHQDPRWAAIREMLPRTQATRKSPVKTKVR